MDDIRGLIERAEQDCAEVFARCVQVERKTFARVMKAFQEERIAPQHFAGTTGYGYGDVGRDALERVLAQALECEDALVRPQIASGTHALAICLFGLLRPGDTLLSAAGKPYDTLDSVIGLGDTGQGSLREFGVAYRQAELTAEGLVSLHAIEEAVDSSTKVVLIQRSRGYAWRPSLTLEEIEKIAQVVRKKSKKAIIMVDNCYGEFTSEHEPSRYGADLIVGSLIKNPGGGLASTGGYIAGKREIVEQTAFRLTSPGIGREVGSYAAGYREFFQGLYLAPHVVSQAKQTAILGARIFAELGYSVQPAYDAVRSDIIQAIELGEEERLIAFCQGVQMASPIDSFALPEPWAMPGYQDPVIMAAGTFVSGASIELSADAPVRPPFIVYLQGGLTYEHGRLAMETILKRMNSCK